MHESKNGYLKIEQNGNQDTMRICIYTPHTHITKNEKEDNDEEAKNKNKRETNKVK